jgi:putative transposase
VELRKQGHCAYRCEYHLVLVSKYRKKIFNPGSYSYFEKILHGIKEQQLPEVSILEMNHDKDHVHLLASIPPKMRVSDVVRIIKSISGRLMKQRYDYLKKAYYGSDGIWSDGYFVATVGVNEHVIRKYIEKQGQEDSGQAKLELG